MSTVGSVLVFVLATGIVQSKSTGLSDLFREIARNLDDNKISKSNYFFLQSTSLSDLTDINLTNQRKQIMFMTNALINHYNCKVEFISQ